MPNVKKIVMQRWMCSLPIKYESGLTSDVIFSTLEVVENFGERKAFWRTIISQTNNLSTKVDKFFSTVDPDP